MTLTELFLDQLAKEAGPTRRILERVPEGRNDWKPHPKSMELGYLAAHVATLPTWIPMTVDRDSIDLHTPEGQTYIPKAAATTKELVDLFDDAVAKARESLSKTTDDHLMKSWRFLVDGRVISEYPRCQGLRDMIFSHLAHHRAQLGVYLRLNDIALPGTYGPSADEKVF